VRKIGQQVALPLLDAERDAASEVEELVVLREGGDAVARELVADLTVVAVAAAVVVAAARSERESTYERLEFTHGSLLAWTGSRVHPGREAAEGPRTRVLAARPGLVSFRRRSGLPERLSTWH